MDFSNCFKVMFCASNFEGELMKQRVNETELAAPDLHQMKERKL